MKGKLLAIMIVLLATTQVCPVQARTAINAVVSDADGGIGGGSDAPEKRPGYLRVRAICPHRNRGSRSMAMPTHGGNRQRDRYARGHTPEVGAVLALEPYRNSHLGHVAAVTRG